MPENGLENRVRLAWDLHLMQDIAPIGPKRLTGCNGFHGSG